MISGNIQLKEKVNTLYYSFHTQTLSILTKGTLVRYAAQLFITKENGAPSREGLGKRLSHGGIRVCELCPRKQSLLSIALSLHPAVMSSSSKLTQFNSSSLTPRYSTYPYYFLSQLLTFTPFLPVEITSLRALVLSLR